MLRHIVMFSCKEPGSRDLVRSALARLGDISHASHFEVAFNTKTDPLGTEVDIVVYGEFESAEALAAYKADPIYHETIRIVRPLRDIRMAADFDIGTALKGSGAITPPAA